MKGKERADDIITTFMNFSRHFCAVHELEIFTFAHGKGIVHISESTLRQINFAKARYIFRQLL